MVRKEEARCNCYCTEQIVKPISKRGWKSQSQTVYTYHIPKSNDREMKYTSTRRSLYAMYCILERNPFAWVVVAALHSHTHTTKKLVHIYRATQYTANNIINWNYVLVSFSSHSSNAIFNSFLAFNVAVAVASGFLVLCEFRIDSMLTA